MYINNYSTSARWIWNAQKLVISYISLWIHYFRFHRGKSQVTRRIMRQRNMWYVTLYCSIVFEVQTQWRLLYSLQLNARKLSREKHSSRPFHCYEQFANSLSCFWVVETLKWKNAVLPTQLNKIRNNYKTFIFGFGQTKDVRKSS